MSLFWKWRQQERDNNKEKESHNLDKAIATISARLRFLELLTAELVAELPPKKRAGVLVKLRGVVLEQKILPSPPTVPPGKEQEYYDELRTAVQILIENNEFKLLRALRQGPEDAFES